MKKRKQKMVRRIKEIRDDEPPWTFTNMVRTEEPGRERSGLVGRLDSKFEDFYLGLEIL